MSCAAAQSMPMRKRTKSWRAWRRRLGCADDYLRLVGWRVDGRPLVFHLRRGAQSVRPIPAGAGRRSHYSAFPGLFSRRDRAGCPLHCGTVVSPRCAAQTRRIGAADPCSDSPRIDPHLHPTRDGRASARNTRLRAAARHFHGAESFLLDCRSTRFFVGSGRPRPPALINRKVFPTRKDTAMIC